MRNYSPLSFNQVISTSPPRLGHNGELDLTTSGLYIISVLLYLCFPNVFWNIVNDVFSKEKELSIKKVKDVKLLKAKQLKYKEIQDKLC